jgi:membrane protease YdiL (CAAX protease family)
MLMARPSEPALRGASPRAGWRGGAVAAVVLAAPCVAALWAAQQPSHGPLAWQALLVLLLIAPVAEECVFRAGLQDWLERRAGARLAWSPRARAAAAIGLSSAVFALCHVAGQGSWWALATFVPSLVLGMLYRAGGLRLAIACHAWFNLCFVLAALPR